MLQRAGDDLRILRHLQRAARDRHDNLLGGTLARARGLVCGRAEQKLLHLHLTACDIQRGSRVGIAHHIELPADRHLAVCDVHCAVIAHEKIAVCDVHRAAFDIQLSGGAGHVPQGLSVGVQLIIPHEHAAFSDAEGAGLGNINRTVDAITPAEKHVALSDIHRAVNRDCPVPRAARGGVLHITGERALPAGAGVEIARNGQRGTFGHSKLAAARRNGLPLGRRAGARAHDHVAGYLDLGIRRDRGGGSLRRADQKTIAQALGGSDCDVRRINIIGRIGLHRVGEGG